jgi:hypothetical protein
MSDVNRQAPAISRAATLGPWELAVVLGGAFAYVAFYLWFKNNAPYWFAGNGAADAW